MLTVGDRQAVAKTLHGCNPGLAKARDAQTPAPCRLELPPEGTLERQAWDAWQAKDLETWHRIQDQIREAK